MLDLIARGGLRVREVLRITPRGIEDWKITLNDPKRGRESDATFMPQNVAERLKDYIREKEIPPERRVLPIIYTAAQAMVKKAGEPVEINLRPHDLRRHAATYASSSGTPIEIVSKIILKHANLSAAQRYLGKISDHRNRRYENTTCKVKDARCEFHIPSATA